MVLLHPLLDDAVARQIALEIADVLEALFPDVLGNELGLK